jgi:hypothetical protein
LALLGLVARTGHTAIFLGNWDGARVEIVAKIGAL